MHIYKEFHDCGDTVGTVRRSHFELLPESSQEVSNGSSSAGRANVPEVVRHSDGTTMVCEGINLEPLF